ncbi:MAG TPA: hypothetical protein PKK06_17285 [Phycisphaerae bacterium]|nr:hypothetical protein [Phycisphaerae bacterium]HNU46947.1 hypothetical protein [Phycisphaerae bacterium]
MQRIAPKLAAVAAVAMGLGGCGPGEWEPDALATLVGVDGVHAFYQWQAYGQTEAISSLWMVDLSTGESRKLRDVAVWDYPLAAGDYFVFTQYEEVEPGVSTDVLYGAQISTGEEFVIWRTDPDQWIYSSFLDGTAVAILLDDSRLVVYDLPTRTVVRELDAPRDALGLSACSAGRALFPLESDSDPTCSRAVLLDTSTGELLEIPPARPDEALPEPGSIPEGENYAWEWFGLSPTWVVTAQTTYLYDDDAGEMRQGVWAYNLLAQTWKHVADSEGLDMTGLLPHGGLAYVGGVSDTHVLVEYLSTAGLRVKGRLELIELDTGDVTVVNRYTWSMSALGSMGAQLHGRRVYWIEWNDKLPDTLVIWDMDTQQRREVLLGHPE